MKNVFIALCTMMWLIAGCSTTGTHPYSLGSPKFVPQTAPTAAVEEGIGEDTSPAGGIYLQWKQIVGVAGYRVYRTDSVNVNGLPAGFEFVASAPPTDTSITDNYSVLIGTRYYYSLRAVAPDQSLSGWSDTVSITLLSRPMLVSPVAGAPVSKIGLAFTWKDNTGGGSTVLRLRDITSPKDIYVSPSLFSNYNANPVFQYDTVTTAFDSLTSGHKYQWRIDRFNLGTDQQAKSIWQTFTVN